MALKVGALHKKNDKKTTKQSFLKNYDLYILILPVLLYFLIFKYLPMYGVQIAFKDFYATKGIWGSDWVGLKHFRRFVKSYQFLRLMKNTLGLSLYQLIIDFPIPIILALMINEVYNRRFKKMVQTVTYMPHFISTVVLVGMLTAFLSPRSGIANNIITLFGGEPVYFMAEPKWFKTLYVFSGIWQQTGWSSIIYIAALAGIDPSLHEAAKIDGATRMQRIWHVNIPGILPTVIILFIMRVGKIMNIGFEKVLLMQNDLNISSADIISTYVYRSGILGGEFSFSSAVGLFNSVINFILLITVNKIAKKVGETSLW